MRKLLWISLFVFLLAGGAFAQSNNNNFRGSGCITKVANLSSACGTIKGTVASVNDGLTATDCTSGGGSTPAFCQYSGSVWAAVSGGGGGTVLSVSGTASQISSTGGANPVLSLTNPLVTPGPVTVTGGTLTTDVQPLKVTATYNNAAQAFNGVEFVTVDTAHQATSYLLQVLGGVAGTTQEHVVDTSGNVVDAGTDTATAQKAVGATAGVLEVTQGPATTADANSAGFMAPTSIPTAYVILMPTAAAASPGVFTLGTVSAGVSQGGFSSAPVLGIDNSVAGSIQLASLAAAAHTTIASVATTSNTVNFPATTPTDSDLLCASVPTSNVLTIADCGVLKTNLVTAAGTLASTALMTGGGSKAAQTPCATCTLSSGGQIVLVAGGSLGSADVNTPTITFAASKISVSQPLTLGVTSNQLVSGTSTNLTTVNFPASSGAVTVTMPNTTDTMVGRATTDTLTNKTLTSPVINTQVTGTAVQGTDTLLLSAGTVSGTGASLCTDANGGATTSGCTSGGGAIVNVSELTKTAAVTTFTLCAAATCGNGAAHQYRIDVAMWSSGTACATVGAAALGMNLTWTDENAVAHTTIVIPQWNGATFSTVFNPTTALGTSGSWGTFGISTNGTIIQAATTYAACTSGTFTYNIRYAVFQIS